MTARLRDAIALAALALLARGLLAFDIGLWQDDAALLAAVRATPGGFFARFVHPLGSPTRLLLGAPDALALATPHPLLVLQLLGVLSWLGIGLAARALARELFPGEERLAFAAAALTLCATPDLLTGSLVSLGYDLSILVFLAAAVLLLAWLARSGTARLAGAGALLLASLFTTDAAALPALLLPFVAFGARRDAPRRRLAAGAAVWWGAMLPWALLFARALLDPRSYAAGALLPLAWGVRAARLVKLFAWNFTPPLWAFDRRTWFPAPEAAISTRARALLALAALVLFAWGLRAHADSGRTPVRRGAAACLFLALAANAAFASVRFADVCYRTHLLSRVFAAVVVAALAAALASARPRLAPAAWGAAGLFAAFGVWGGLERQDYFLGSWRAHRAELASILEAAPSLRPGAALVLRVPPGTPPFRATHVGYLAQAWTSLLYERTDLPCFLADEENGSRCAAEGTRLACRDAATGDAHTFAADRLVVLTFSKGTGRFALEREVPGLTGYAPAARILPARRGPLARELLSPQTPLSGLFPDKMSRR